MKKATGSCNFFWEFYSYDVNVKKKFSNFPIFTTVATRLVQVLHMLPLLKVANLGTRRRVEGWVFLDLKGQVGFFDPVVKWIPVMRKPVRVFRESDLEQTTEKLFSEREKAFWSGLE